MSSTPPNEADTPPRGDVAEGGNPQPMKESEGRSLMSLKMRIASGGKNASRDQLDFVKTVDGDLTLAEAECDLLKEENFVEGGNTRATWIVAGSLLPRDVPLKDIEKLNRSDDVVVQVFLQTSQASGDSDDSTTGRSGNNTVNLDRMDTFEDSVSIFAYAVSGLGIAFTWKYLFYSEAAHTDGSTTLLQSLTRLCVYAFTLLWIATVFGVLFRNLPLRNAPTYTSPEAPSTGTTEGVEQPAGESANAAQSQAADDSR
ncbi:hypothetical protein Pmar_PMAR021288 [Perkinsus marinus ATCC 50983]|uniref:Uncharacterized protein n=1 Tax=Perkinsus marinus (strain ATCC 50983 / TXsc) TaxID=423536 RepID=C5LB04_PERM5|nr:hypothetical protein Pmar_PMAR021288 [Perkinsus marinus ATCC 50983]EER06098.1 hypothetical protein Pmar_PMAR021288 [Perkinsus marinus ATCC 50983]|eukprot:XP_002774282.1 hypothetical protein Pmar_PMAR021288 [Perkinsus marinus ATCC 50983]